MNKQIKFYSQIGQDYIAISLLKGKLGGTFLDIGCGHPERINNTLALEKEFSWTGLSIDIDKEYEKYWKESRPDSNFMIANALELDYDLLLEDGTISSDIDFLSLDLEPPSVTFDALKRIPFDKIKFNVIACEHDGYRMGEEFKEEMREYLKSHDYILFKELNNQDDVWLHSSFVEEYK